MKPYLTSALALALALASCKNDSYKPSPWLEATARVDGNFVEVTATCTRDGGYRLEAHGTKGECKLGTPAVMRIPAGVLGAGKQTVTITDSYSREKPYTLEIDIPASATGPFFIIGECGYATDEINLELDVTGQGKVDCYTTGGARAKLPIRATPGATATIGGKPVTIPASGELDHIVDLSAGILGLTIDELVAERSAGDGAPLVVPYVFEADGKKTEGTLSFTARFGQKPKLLRRWLLDVVDGKVDRPAFTPAAAGERKTIVLLPPSEYADLTATDRRGTVKELDLVAVTKEGTKTPAGNCEFEVDGKPLTAKKNLIEHAVKVISLADGTTVAEKTFAPKDECPMFATFDRNKPEIDVSPDDAVVLAWLETMAAR